MKYYVYNCKVMVSVLITLIRFTYRTVTTDLENLKNLEISGNFVILQVSEKSGNLSKNLH